MATERVVKVTLTAQMQGYIAAMEKAAKATKETATEGQKLAETKRAFDALGRGMLAAGGLMAVGLGVAISRATEFTSAMSAAQAATGESAEGMEALADAALDAGSRTVFSATEAANAITELGKAGVSTSDILSGGLDAALDLAAAGGLAVADAAGIAAVALKTFNLEGDDMSHVADLLSAGAGKAMGDVTDLSQALNQTGQVANSTGLSIDETTAALAAFASQGLLGSDAGTSFKTMLSALTPNSAAAAKEMERLGISAYDATGQFVGLENFAGNLQTSLKGLTIEQRSASLEIIFGQDAVRAANVLYREGADGIAEWTRKVDDQGYATRTAATLLDNLKGDVEALGGAFDSALIESGSFANDTLRGLVQSATGLVNAFGDMPAPLQATAVGIGSVAAATGLLGGAAILTVPKLAEFQATLRATGGSVKGAIMWAGLGGVALAGFGAIVAELAKDQEEARQKTESYASTLEEGSRKITKATREMARENLAAKDSFFWLELDSAFDAADKLGISLDLVTDAALGNAKALKQLQREMDASNDQSFDMANAYATLANSVKGEAASIEQAIEVAKQKARVDIEVEGTTRDAAEAYLDAADDASEYNDKLSSLIDTLNELNGVGQSAASANVAFKDALAEVDEAVQKARAGVEGYGLGLDVNTEAGRDNVSMLIDLASKSQAAAEKQFGLDQNTDAYKQSLIDGRQALIDRARDLGANATEAENLANQIYAIPEETEFKVVADTQAAEAALQRLNAALNYVDNTDPVIVVNQVGGGGIGRRAGGGAIYGPGSGTSDTAGLYALSNGEHVLTASDVAAMGGQHSVYAWRYGLHNGSGGSGGGGGGDVYVQSPFTGEYLLAQVATVADGRIAHADRNLARAIQNGG